MLYRDHRAGGINVCHEIGISSKQCHAVSGKERERGREGERDREGEREREREIGREREIWRERERERERNF